VEAWSRLEPGAAALGLATAALAAAAATTMGPQAFAIPVGLALAVFFVWQPLVLLTLLIYVGLYKEQAGFQALPLRQDARAGCAARRRLLLPLPVRPS
jgi:hypothetical protein